MDALFTHRGSKNNGGNRRHYRSRGRRVRHGQQAAVVRALTAAKLYIDGAAPSFVAAAAMCGSCPQYVEAAFTLTKSGDAALLRDVVRGETPLLAAAKRVRELVALVDAYHRAKDKPHALARFGQTIGAEILFDSVITPAI
jgi:hypothetical protein